jgi:Leucine-rich repeat (LRR) protein
MLGKADCVAWKEIVQPSPYFTQTPSPLCLGGHYKYNPCSCNGTLGCDDGRIVSIDLQSRHAPGIAFDIDKEDALSHLSGLQSLNVSSNSLTGPMPKWLKVLAGSLVELQMNDNPFTGPIDIVKNLKQLKNLQLSNYRQLSYFNGTIDAVKGLVNLEKLRLNGLHFEKGAGLDIHFTGPIDAVTGLTKLKTFECVNNYLSGTLDPLAALTQLTFLNVRYNFLTGTVDMLKGLASLERLWLQGNRLTGGIDALKQLTNLQGQPKPTGFWPGLWLANNQFTGPIDVVYNMHELQGLDLSNNSFTGTIGDGFRAQNMPNLTYIDLSVNNFTAVPSNLVDWSRFTDRCDLHHQAFTCSTAMAIPSQAKSHCGATCCVGSSADLVGADCDTWQNVVLKSRYFTKANPPACNEPQHIADPCSCAGVITCDGGRIVGVDLHNRSLVLNASADDSLSHLGGLQTLMLGTTIPTTNKLVGPLPTWLGKLTALTKLDLSYNQLSGPIDIVAKLTSLRRLALGVNQLTGSIDPVANLTALTTLTLINNQLSGPLDPIANLTALTTMWLSRNQLTGSIDAVAKLTSLTFLGLGGNQLSGPIDPVAKFTSLGWLDLGGNNYSGVIPAGPINWTKIGQCNGCICDLSGNHFSCPLPPGVNKTHCHATCQ